jgi:lipopolysaccharide/colanic/teichoic acid biosynthesis glycosyltransferase
MVQQTQSTFNKTQENKSPRRFSLGELGKRAFDFLFALVGLVLLSPFLGLIAVWIKRDSPGPVFYRGRRSAMGGREFEIIKFRTMYEDENSYAGPKVTAEDDPRVTPVGKWLRDTKINELPQLWNVLKGQMSLVGPRPEDPEIVEAWPEEVRGEILSVRPGITSPASVLYRDEENLLQSDTLMDTYLNAIAPNKQRLDQLYVRHRGFLLDLDVLLWTFLLLIPRAGRYQPAEDRLYLGPVSLFTQRYLSWFTIDTLTTFLAFAITGLFWRSLGPLKVGWSKSIAFAILFALVFSIIGAILRINRIDWPRANAGDVADLLPAVFVATLVVFGINWGLERLPARPAWEQTVRETLQTYGIVWGLEFFPSGLILMASILATVGFIVVRYRSRLLTGFLSRIVGSRRRVQAASERVLIVGGGQAGQFAIWWLNTGEYAEFFHPVGIVDDDLYKQGVRIRGVNVVGRRADIQRLVSELDVGIIVFAIHKISSSDRDSLLEICQATQAQIVMLPDFLGSLNLARTVNGAGNGKKHQVGALWLPDGIPAEQVDSWLDQIEEMAAQGDLEAVQDLIEEVRGSFWG